MDLPDPEVGKDHKVPALLAEVPLCFCKGKNVLMEQISAGCLSVHRAESSLTRRRPHLHLLPSCSAFMMLLPCSQIHILALGTKPQRCPWSFCPSQPASGAAPGITGRALPPFPASITCPVSMGDPGEGFTNASVDREGWRELCLSLL